MKTWIVVLSVFFAAQAAWTKTYVGGLLGYRSNTMATEGSSSDYRATTGYQAGLLILFPLVDPISFRTGLLYTVKNVEYKTSIFGRDLTIKDNLSYWDVPLNIQVQLRPTSLSVFGGAKVGVKSSSNCDVDTASTGLVCNAERNSPNWVYNLGAGYFLIDFDSLKLGIEGEYESGVTNINGSGSSKLYTRAWIANAVLLFGF